MKVHPSILAQSELSTTDRKNLLMLQQEYFDNVVPEVFLSDLAEKDWIILIRDDQGKVHGFSTIQLIWLKLELINHLYLFSGDTIIREEVRNNQSLAVAFIHFMYSLLKQFPSNPIFWFLISKGYRTYRFLPMYFKEYFPVHDKSIPEYYQQALDTVALFKYGQQYHPKEHLIRYNEPRDYLNPLHAQIPNGRLKDPDIEYFSRINPMFYKGEELTCIASIHASNFKPIISKIYNNSQMFFNLE